MNPWTIPVLAAVACCALNARAQESPETDEARFIRLTHQLEISPLSDTDKSMRSWLLQWAMDSKDITVNVCNLLGPIPKDDAPNSGIFVTQMIFGNASYQISHPEKRKDPLSPQVAGIRSALKAYDSILAKDPKARIPFLDDLVKRDKDGTLEAHMAPIVGEKCKDSAAD